MRNGWARLRTILARADVVEAALLETARVTTDLSIMSPDEVWRSLVVQIAVVGGASAGNRLRESQFSTRLSWARIAALSGDDERAGYIHEILRDAGVRYVGRKKPAQKARMIAALSRHPRVANDSRFHFDGEIQGAMRQCSHSEVELRRQIVGWHVPGFGPKSTSDWLTNRGVASDLLAIDVRVCRVLQAYVEPALDQAKVARMGPYEELEGLCRRNLARPMALSLGEIDKRMFVLATDLRRKASRNR